MAQVQMNISITSQLAEMVRKKVSSGMYNNASEVVRDALRRLDEQNQQQRLRELLLPRIAKARKGEFAEYNIDDIIDDLDDLDDKEA